MSFRISRTQTVWAWVYPWSAMFLIHAFHICLAKQLLLPPVDFEPACLAELKVYKVKLQIYNIGLNGENQLGPYYTYMYVYIYMYYVLIRT